MLFKPNRGTKKGIVSCYNNKGFVKSIECENVVIQLDAQTQKITASGNKNKLCGISTCHAFLSGKLLLMNGTIHFQHFLNASYDQIIYHVSASKFICESGAELKENDLVLINAITKKCYVMRDKK